MVIWHVFDELCDEMKKYNIDKRTPFRYRRGGRMHGGLYCNTELSNKCERR